MNVIYSENMSRKEGIIITTGSVDGSTYIVFSYKPIPDVTGFRYGQQDKLIERAKNRRKTAKVPLSSFVRNEWTEWLKQKSDSDYSISEYKKKHKRKLPFWAIDFGRRGIYKTQIDKSPYKSSTSLPDNSRRKEFWFIERELLLPDKATGRKVIVERVFNVSGLLNQVTLIHLNEVRSLLLVHEENKVSKGKWVRTTREVDDERFVNKTWPTFRDLPDKWSTYF